MSLSSLDLLKDALGIPRTASKLDATLSAYLSAAEKEVLSYLCLDTDGVTSYAVAADLREPTSIVRIGPRPVVSVSNVTLYGNTLDAADYRLKGGLVVLCDACVCSRPSWWPGSPRGGAVECRAFTADVTAGFAGTDDAVALGVALLAAWYQQGGGQGVKRHRIRTHEIEFQSAADRGGGAGGHWPALLTNALGPHIRTINIPTAYVDL